MVGFFVGFLVLRDYALRLFLANVFDVNTRHLSHDQLSFGICVATRPAAIKHVIGRCFFQHGNGLVGSQHPFGPRKLDFVHQQKNILNYKSMDLADSDLELSK